MESELIYGNWVRRRILVVLALSTLGAASLIFLPIGYFRIIPLVLSFFLLASFLFPLYAYLMFSQAGGKFQEKIYQLIIQSLGEDVNGCILDIGAGNGVLAVTLAKQYEHVEVVGLDYWGKDWEYSKSVCEANAKSARVDNRVIFQKGDAARLDFADSSFDGVTSNLTFHEVQSVADKRDVVREALRVLKPGGRFAFVDYFFDSSIYGQPSEFRNYLTEMSLSRIEYEALHDNLAIPVLLRLPRILGRVGVLYGTK